MESVNEWAAARHGRSLDMSPSGTSDSVGHSFEVLREKQGVRKGLAASARLPQTQHIHTCPPPRHATPLASKLLLLGRSKSRGDYLYKVLIQ